MNNTSQRAGEPEGAMRTSLLSADRLRKRNALAAAKDARLQPSRGNPRSCPNAGIAQMAERRFCTPHVRGSIPLTSSMLP